MRHRVFVYVHETRGICTSVDSPPVQDDRDCHCWNKLTTPKDNLCRVVDEVKANSAEVRCAQQTESQLSVGERWNSLFPVPRRVPL